MVVCTHTTVWLILSTVRVKSTRTLLPPPFSTLHGMHLSQYPSQPYRTRVLKVEKEMADVLDDKVQVACPVEADPENPTTKTKKGKEKPAREPYLLCELCNNILTDSGHKKQEHREIDQLRALGAASLLPPMATAALDSASDEMLGGFIHHLLREADRGEEVFNVIRNATEQLHKLLHESLAERPNVFLFGSCVSMGIWDGLGDADFALDSPGLKNGSIKEGELLDLLARKLRHGGFQFNELEVVKRTRIPVIKRARGTKRAYELLRVRDPYILRYCFPSSGVRAIFLSKLKYLEKKYEGKCVVSKESDEVLMYCTNGAKALRLFSRLEEKGMVKEWKMNGRLPEIFSVDFDLSCRLHGVRNSWFLRQYMKQDSIFRVGNLFIKRWSKVSGVNNPRRGYLTSYAMTVLWVYYLLVKKEATFVNPESITVDHETQHDVNYLPLWKSEEASASVWSRLGQLVRGFFNFYDNFAWDQEVVCLRYDVAKTGARTREEHGWTREAEVDTVVLRDRVLYRLCIDDVYEDGLNLGRHQDDDKAAYVRLQFHRASLLCNASSPDTLPLLLENTPQHASSTVNVELYRYLAERSGHATVGEIRAHFAASPNAPFLSVYEVSNRLSDMWYDVAMLANDASENRYFGRWVDPNKPKPVWPAMDSWAAVCVDAYWAHEIATHDKRVVRLVANRTEEDPLGDEDPNASELESQLAIATKECCSIAQQLAREDVRHVGVPITESTSDLAKNYFFCVDDCRAFDTYREQMVFVAHLRTVALVLEKGHPMDHTTLGSDEDLIHSEGLALLSWQYKSNIAASILSCEFYVKKGTRHGEPTYTATDLLLHHLGDRGDEETIQRRSCFKKHFISSQ